MTKRSPTNPDDEGALVPTSDYDRATHEAGHAVIALVLGMPMTNATIESEREGWGGSITHDGRCGQWRQSIAVFMAGELAVQFAYGETNASAEDFTDNLWSEGDRALIEDAAH